MRYDSDDELGDARARNDGSSSRDLVGETPGGARVCVCSRGQKGRSFFPAGRRFTLDRRHALKTGQPTGFFRKCLPAFAIFTRTTGRARGHDGCRGNRGWAHHRGCWDEPVRAASGGPQPGRDGLRGKPGFAGTRGGEQTLGLIIVALPRIGPTRLA